MFHRGTNGASPVSRHHTPPLVTSPDSAKAKEIRHRRGASSVWRRRAAAGSDEADDIDDIPRLAPRSSQPPVEATERHIPSPSGKLSADTLKVMLEAQEATTKDETQS
jgi:hypothetical protein